MGALIGIDVGQRHEHSGLCTVEEDRRGEKHYKVRHLERLPSGTNFPRLAERAAEVAQGTRRQLGKNPQIYINATGLGQPIVDLVQRRTRPSTIVAVYFTHGDRMAEESRKLILGKAFLVSRLQLLLQTGRLHLPRTDEAELLANELLDYEIEVDPDANERYGAFRVGSRDELVTALGMAVSGGRRIYSAVFYGGGLGGGG